MDDMRFIPSLVGIGALLPLVASAASAQELIKNVLIFANTRLLPFLLGIAFLFIVYNAFRFFIVEGASKEGQTKAKSLAIYGVLAFVFIVIFWGAVKLLSESIGLQGQKAPTPDYVQQYKK
jgi:uncharacterized membrane protein YidH (DUF202 family)